MIGSCRLGNRQGHHYLEDHGRGWNLFPYATPTTGRHCLDFELMGTCMYWYKFWCTKCLLCMVLITSSLAHTALVLYTTIVNYYSWLHHSIDYDQWYHTRCLVIVTNNNTNTKILLWERWKQEWSVHITFCNSDNFASFLLTVFFSYEQSRALPMMRI